MSSDYPTLSYLRQCFNYDPNTGKLWWKLRPLSHFQSKQEQEKSHNKTGRKRAGFVDKHTGYRKVRLDGKMYREHRLIWAIATGSWPEDDIDHINHARDDNRFANLRVAGKHGNSLNHSLYKSNQSGVSGVYWHHGAWRARIRPNGKTIYLGTFHSIKEAEAAVIAARTSQGFHENHGMPKS